MKTKILKWVSSPLLRFSPQASSKSQESSGNVLQLKTKKIFNTLPAQKSEAVEPTNGS